MSKFTEVPYIERVLSELSGEDKAILLNYINGRNADNTAAISYSLKNMTEIVALTAGVTPITYRYSSRIHWRGYILKTENYRCFLTFKTGIDLVDADLYDVSSGNLIHKDTVSADTIRALLREDAYVDVTEASTLGGGGDDDDVTVEIENTYTSTSYNSRTDYEDPISLKDFIANCEDGVYTHPGTIAKISNLINGKTFRIILIGVSEDHLVYNYSNASSDNAKTTWQFLDVPTVAIGLGLPFNIFDWVTGNGSRTSISSYVNGTNASSIAMYASNMDGLPSAGGLLQACQAVFNGLPDMLKKHIKVVRRKYYCPRYKYTVAAEGGTETPEGKIFNMVTNVFLLSDTDLNMGDSTSPTGEGCGGYYSYFNSGNSYTNQQRRIRFTDAYGSGTNATLWWTASPHKSVSYRWHSIYTNGNLEPDGVSKGAQVTEERAIAPAFCI